MIGAVLVSIGYVAAIFGGIVLFKNTPPDVGGTHALIIPVVDGFQIDEETADIASRQWWNRLGFVLLTVGSAMQLAGYWADRLS